MPANPTPAEGVVVIDEKGRLDLTDKATLGCFIGKSLATFVSGNRMPEISGDDRKRISEHTRRHYDRAAEQAAGYILDYLAARPAAPTQRAAQTGEVERLRAALERIQDWLRYEVPVGTRSATVMLKVVNNALSQPEAGR